MINDIIPIDEGEIVLYQPDNTTSLEVKLEQDTVWLSQAQMVELFQTTKQNVSLHISNIFKEGELHPELVVKESLTTTPHGAIPGKFQKKKVKLYNLDVIISVGYRVKSQRGTQFRRWATNVLRDLEVDATIHTTYNKKFNDALEAHNSQQRPIQAIQLPHKIHDRFLIIDSQVYLLGNSLKDMGHTLSAAILTGFTPEEVLSKLK